VCGVHCSGRWVGFDTLESFRFQCTPPSSQCHVVIQCSVSPFLSCPLHIPSPIQLGLVCLNTVLREQKVFCSRKPIMRTMDSLLIYSYPICTATVTLVGLVSPSLSCPLHPSLLPPHPFIPPLPDSYRYPRRLHSLGRFRHGRDHHLCPRGWHRLCWNGDPA
jgi:hypothetical protein